jgi:hypothetical protein
LIKEKSAVFENLRQRSIALGKYIEALRAPVEEAGKSEPK